MIEGEGMRLLKIIISIILVCVVITVIVLWNVARVSASFATSAIIKYNYMGVYIEEVITDETELAELKNVLSGFAWTDSPSCGFSADISITFTDGNKELVLCPACDGDPIIRVGESDRYIGISDEARNGLDAIVEKYGMIFPCI